MIAEDQSAVIDFLAAPSTHAGTAVERIDTHASIVFLAGARAYKLKRAVRFDYLDFSTAERRRALCEAEVRLNRRTAPTLYRGVVAVTRQDDGSYALGGHGRPVDWLVEMNRFPQEALFDRLASGGALGIELMSPLADPRRRLEIEGTARDYLAMAEQFLHPPPPCLVAIGGFSGSGKSTLALGLAPSVGPVPGAVVLRSDEIRKGLCGVPLLQRLGPEGYSSPASERVYSTMAEHAALVLRAGHSVVVDAVYARPADRRVVEQVAETASVPFIGLWLDAPESLLVERTTQRRNDASDADASVVRSQRAQDIGDMRWFRLDASVAAASVLSSATDRVREREASASTAASIALLR